MRYFRRAAMPASRVRLFALIAACAGLLACTGCHHMFAFMVASFARQPKVDAVYRPPENKKVLVFIDDYVRQVDSPLIKSKLSESVGAELMDHEVAAEVVGHRELTRFRGVTRDFSQLPVDEVGRRLRADLVVHIDIRQFQLRDDPSSPLWQGKLKVRVRVVSVEDGLLWPIETRDGYEVEVETPMITHASGTYDQQLTEQLALMMADKVAKLFYDHREGD